MTVGEEDLDRMEGYMDMEDIEDEPQFWEWFNETFKAEQKAGTTKRQKMYIGKPLIQRKFGKDDKNWFAVKTNFGRWRDTRTGRFTKNPNN